MSVVVVTNAVLDGSDRLDLYGHYKGEDFHYSVDGREWVLRFAGGAPIVSALPRRTVPVGEPIRFLPDSGMNSRYFSWWHRLPDGTFLIYSPIKRTLARSLDVPRLWIKFCERLTDLRWLFARAPRKEKQLLRQVRREFVSEVLKEDAPGSTTPTSTPTSQANQPPSPLPPPKRRIWLYFDKLYKGGDNGECQFRHACTKDDGIEHLYLVRRKTATYRQLVADGYKDKLLRPKSRAAIEAILRAEYVFLTHHPRWEYLGLSRRSWEYLANLVSARTVTAFHGLVIPALTNVARTSDNAELVFLASDFERRNLLAERYQFAEHQLKLTGHPRFDALGPDRAGFVIIAPTWRRDTVTGHGRRHEYPDFYSSEYYGIYNELLSDGKWLGSLMSLGYSVKFLLHPVMSESMDHFGPYPGVDIIPGRAADYIELMSTADAMVTDYSGIGFDFAYTGKPLFYFQPPELPEHYAKSPVFDYERDGFGPVLTTSKALKTALLTAAKDRFPQLEGYQARVEHFFAHRDHNNAERIYQTMLGSTNCAGGRPPCNPRA